MLFEKASRLKLRFDSTQGQLSVEDLWDLPLSATKGRTCLDDLAVGLDKALKEAGTTSFVKKATRINETLRLKFDLVLRVIEVRQAEAEAADLKQVNAEKKQKLLELLAKKKDAALEGLTAEELEKQINAL
jgi:hypothetical protein